MAMTAYVCSLKACFALKTTIQAAGGDDASREAGANLHALAFDLQALAARHGFVLDTATIPYSVTYGAVP